MRASSHHILVIEDDKSLAQWICDYLSNHNFLVTQIHTGETAINTIKQLEPDLVLLDVMLPHKNGFEICKEAREFYACPILMMTAGLEESDEILSLELGADDYLNKPVRPRVLLARIKALLRRPAIIPAQPTIDLDQLLLEKSTKSVSYQQQSIGISSTEFDVLWLLATQKNNIVSRAELVSQLRGIDYDGFDRSIDIRVSRLRKKLAEHTQRHTIKTVWGKGYVFSSNSD